MTSVHQISPGVNPPGPFDVRHQVPDDGPDQRGQAVGYAFDPIPSIRFDRRLKPIDHLILVILISFAIWRDRKSVV